jgi:hypothetical protein
VELGLTGAGGRNGPGKGDKQSILPVHVQLACYAFSMAVLAHSILASKLNPMIRL